MSDVTDLNERERDILQRIAQGQSNREIADELYLSLNTVRWYNKHIYSKLGIHSRTGAIARARELGLLDAPGSAGDDDSQPLANVPAPLTPFVGREREVEAVCALLDDPGVRLVTITGPGGMGKTRLAQHVARAYLHRFPDGVYWLALASLEGSARRVIVHALANALRLTFRTDAEAESQVLNYLSRRRLLLLLDNMEHLLDGVGVIADILQAAPGVKILATSREVLGLYGEAVCTLAGLAVPESARQNPLDYDAVRLFVQSAARVRQDFTPDAGELKQIAQICAFVEGLPLGIELAAAWMRSLSLAEVLDELRQGLDILETRTHSLRAVFDRSWQRLSASEQTAFARLSVFRGGWTREAAQSITGASLRQLTALVDKSLLWHLPAGYYAMHELLRQYAAEKLPDSESLVANHGDYYAAFAGRWGRALHTGQQIEALHALDRAFDNIRAAWRWAAQHRHVEALRELIDLWYYFEIRSHWLEGVELFDLALAAVQDDFTRACILGRKSLFTFRLGLSDETFDLAQQSLDILRRMDAGAEIAVPLNSLGIITFLRGSPDQSEAYFQESASIAEQHNDLSRLAVQLGNLSIVEEYRGHLDRAEAYLREQLAIAHRIEDYMSLCLGYLNLGDIEQQKGDLPAALRRYERSIEHAQRVGQMHILARALNEMGVVARLQGRYEEAQRLIEQGMEIRPPSGYRDGLARSFIALGDVAVHRGEIDTARGHYHQALRVSRQMQNTDTSLLALNSVADFYVEQGNTARALEISLLVAAHPATRDDQRQRAAQRVESLRAQLPPAVFESARTPDFNALVDELLLDLRK